MKTTMHGIGFVHVFLDFFQGSFLILCHVNAPISFLALSFYVYVFVVFSTFPYLDCISTLINYIRSNVQQSTASGNTTTFFSFLAPIFSIFLTFLQQFYHPVALQQQMSSSSSSKGVPFIDKNRFMEELEGERFFLLSSTPLLFETLLLNCSPLMDASSFSSSSFTSTSYNSSNHADILLLFEQLELEVLQDGLRLIFFQLSALFSHQTSTHVPSQASQDKEWSRLKKECIREEHFQIFVHLLQFYFSIHSSSSSSSSFPMMKQYQAIFDFSLSIIWSLINYDDYFARLMLQQDKLLHIVKTLDSSSTTSPGRTHFLEQRLSLAASTDPSQRASTHELSLFGIFFDETHPLCHLSRKDCIKQIICLLAR